MLALNIYSYVIVWKHSTVSQILRIDSYHVYTCIWGREGWNRYIGWGSNPPSLPPLPSINLVLHICVLGGVQGTRVNWAGKRTWQHGGIQTSGGSSHKIQNRILRTNASHLESTGIPGSHFGFAGSPKARSSKSSFEQCTPLKAVANLSEANSVQVLTKINLIRTCWNWNKFKFLYHSSDFSGFFNSVIKRSMKYL